MKLGKNKIRGLEGNREENSSCEVTEARKQSDRPRVHRLKFVLEMFKIKIRKCREQEHKRKPGEMARRLGAHPAVPDDLSLVPSTHNGF